MASSIPLEPVLLVPPIRGLEPMEATNGMLTASLNTVILWRMGRSHAYYEIFSTRSYSVTGPVYSLL